MPSDPAIAPPAGRPPDPFMSFVFSASIGASHKTFVIGGFSDVTGLGVETEVQTLRAGGVNQVEITLPGPAKFSGRLVLKRGLGHPAMLWGWYQTILSGAITRELVTINLRSADRRSKMSWTFVDACPVKWIGPEMHAATSAVAFESIELVHRGLLLPPQR